MLRNCFLNFAVEHWFHCRATEPGFAGYIGAMEIWLIDWLIACYCSRVQSTSRLDYSNSLLYGIADIDLIRLQRAQNQLARLVTKSPPFTRSIPLLRSLHWLPVRFRILFKINLLTYNTLHEKQHVYLYSMLAASIPSRSLRSNNDNSLSVPRVRTNTGARAFHSCAPSLWNNLPLSVHLAISVATFKKYVKTHLFDLAFPP